MEETTERRLINFAKFFNVKPAVFRQGNAEGQEDGHKRFKNLIRQATYQLMRKICVDLPDSFEDDINKLYKNFLDDPDFNEDFENVKEALGDFENFFREGGVAGDPVKGKVSKAWIMDRFYRHIREDSEVFPERIDAHKKVHCNNNIFQNFILRNDPEYDRCMKTENGKCYDDMELYLDKIVKFISEKLSERCPIMLDPCTKSKIEIQMRSEDGSITDFCINKHFLTSHSLVDFKFINNENIFYPENLIENIFYCAVRCYDMLTKEYDSSNPNHLLNMFYINCRNGDYLFLKFKDELSRDDFKDYFDDLIKIYRKYSNYLNLVNEGGVLKTKAERDAVRKAEKRKKAKAKKAALLEKQKALLAKKTAPPKKTTPPAKKVSKVPKKAPKKLTLVPKKTAPSPKKPVIVKK